MAINFQISRSSQRLAVAVSTVVAVYVFWLWLGGGEIFDDEKFNPNISLTLANELPCVEMNDAEKVKAALVVNVLDGAPSWQMHTAAVQYFGQPQYRGIDKPRPDILCRDNDIDTKVSSIAIRQDLFNDFFLDPDVLRLASMLGPRDPKIVEGVGKTAFLPRAPNYIPGDVRPLARLVLAEFGAAAAPWSNQAFSAMSADDIAGTAAVKIAIATHHPGALEKASELVTETLARHPYGNLGDRASRRLSELANAMAIAGPDAQPYIGPLIEASKRNLVGHFISMDESPIQFSRPPAYLCWPLKAIGGEPAQAVLDEPWCRKALEYPPIIQSPKYRFLG